MEELNLANEVQRRAAEAILNVKSVFEHSPDISYNLFRCSKNEPGDLRVLLKGATIVDARVIKDLYAKEILPGLTERAARAFAGSFTFPFLRFSGGMASLLEPENESIVREKIPRIAKNSGFSKEFVSMIVKELIKELRRRGPNYARACIGIEHMAPQVAKILLVKKALLIRALLEQ